MTGRKGIAIGIALLIGFFLAMGGILLAILGFTLGLTQAITMETAYDAKTLIEDKLHFDSERHYLENGLWVAGAYAAFKNGENGGIYNDGWDTCSGYVCWRDHDDLKIPPENQVTDEVFERTDDTFQDYFSNTEYTVMEETPLGEPDITPLEMEYDRQEFSFSYRIAELNLSGDSYDQSHEMRERRVWINTTIPIRYLSLYDDASGFATNSRTRLNDKVIDALDDVTVCKGQGQLTQSAAQNKIQDALDGIAGDETNGFEWELQLLQIDDFEEVQGPPNLRYRIVFTVLVTVRDKEDGRRVPNTDSVEKLGIRFALKDEIVFDRVVYQICDCGVECTGQSKCQGETIPADTCDGSVRVIWRVEGTTTSEAPGDCSSGDDCYCEKRIECAPAPCCVDVCCAAGESCCGGTTCCGNACCGGTCCGAGDFCCDDKCCSGDSCCGTTCCSSTCCDGNSCCTDTCIGGSCVDCGGCSCAPMGPCQFGTCPLACCPGCIGICCAPGP